MNKRLSLHLMLVMGCAPVASIALAAPRPNVLFLCIDDLRPELNCFGHSYIHSPNIDKLAQRGRSFTRHFVQAPTCGASRYALLTGQFGSSGNGALFTRSKTVIKTPDQVRPSMPAWFRQHGYTTVSVGKVSHHPGGRGGKDWDDESQIEMPLSWDRHLMPSGEWKHPRGIMHGLAHGEIRGNAREMTVFQSEPGPDTIYPDGLITDTALSELDTLTADTKPFFLAVGIIRPHLPFGAPAKYMEHYKDAQLPAIPHPEKPDSPSTWHGSGEFMKYKRWGKNPNSDPAFAIEVRKHYAACVTYADALVGRIMTKLESSPAADNTIVVLWGDHGWHLGEHAVWGKHTLFSESLRSPLIIATPGLAQPGPFSEAVVSSIDIFPTLCDLAKLPTPPMVSGASLVPQLNNAMAASGRPSIAYHQSKTTIRTETHRLVQHPKGVVELYDLRTLAAETKNVAATQPDVAAALAKKLQAQLKRPR